MSYYTAYLPYILAEGDYDRSYPSPEEQLLWRLDDLYDVLDELKKENAPYGNGYRLSDDDIRYTIPEEFMNPDNDFLRSLSVIERAIELAKSDIVNRYGLPEPDELILEEPIPMNEPCCGQMTFEDCFSAEYKTAA